MRTKHYKETLQALDMWQQEVLSSDFDFDEYPSITCLIKEYSEICFETVTHTEQPNKPFYEKITINNCNITLEWGKSNCYEILFINRDPDNVNSYLNLRFIICINPKYAKLAFNLVRTLLESGMDPSEVTKALNNFIEKSMKNPDYFYGDFKNEYLDE